MNLSRVLNPFIGRPSRQWLVFVSISDRGVPSDNANRAPESVNSVMVEDACIELKDLAAPLVGKCGATSASKATASSALCICDRHGINSAHILMSPRALNLFKAPMKERLLSLSRAAERICRDNPSATNGTSSRADSSSLSYILHSIVSMTSADIEATQARDSLVGVRYAPSSLAHNCNTTLEFSPHPLATPINLACSNPGNELRGTGAGCSNSALEMNALMTSKSLTVPDVSLFDTASSSPAPESLCAFSARVIG
jgi:hypothetical protein